MKALGRAFQIIGLLILPLAMLMELTKFLGRAFGVSHMVIMLVFGVAIFSIGRIMEGYAH